MSIEFKKTVAASGRFPEIWRGECKVLPGGFKPTQDFPVGTLLRRGTLVHVDTAKHTASVVKLATVLSGGTTKAVRVAKGLSFAKADTVVKFGTAPTNGVQITSIDTANADHDVLNLNTAITGLATGDILVETSPDGDTTTGAAYTPNAILAADIEFDGKGIPTLDAAYEAVVLTPSVAYPVPAAWLTGNLCLATNPNILFITQ